MNDGNPKRLPPARWRHVDDCLILFTEPNTAISDGLWGQVLVAIDDGRVNRVLSATGGDGYAKITKKQWRLAAAIIRQRAYPVATVTEHSITLAMTRAANWLGANTVGFKWRDLDDALAHLGVPVTRRAFASTALLELREGIPPLAGADAWPQELLEVGEA
ncbi:hypothetical protein ACNOYE_34490 [Nannocystaceae bacterium ST9]